MAKYNFNLIPFLLVLAIQVKLDSYFIFLTNWHQTLKVTLHLSGPNQIYEKYFFCTAAATEEPAAEGEGKPEKKTEKKGKKGKDKPGEVADDQDKKAADEIAKKTADETADKAGDEPNETQSDAEEKKPSDRIQVK